MKCYEYGNPAGAKKFGDGNEQAKVPSPAGAPFSRTRVTRSIHATTALFHRGVAHGLGHTWIEARVDKLDLFLAGVNHERIRCTLLREADTPFH